MFNRMKLRPYLLMVFSIIIALAAAITALSVTGFLTIKDNTKDFIEITLKAESAVKTSRIEVNAAARDLREMALMSDAADYPPFKSRIEESQQIIKEQIAVFKAAHGERDGLAQRYEDAFTVWFNVAGRVVAQIEQGNSQEAATLILKECSPALGKLVDIAKEIDTQITAEKQDVIKENEKTARAFIITVLSFFSTALAFSILFATKTIASLVKTTNQIRGAVAELSKGNLKVSVDYEARNEFGELSRLMNFSFQELSKYISAIDIQMNEFAKGNFTAAASIEFLGDFSHIKRSVEAFQKRMNHTLAELDASAEQVSAGAELVADSSQTLAQGATEQASSIEALSTNILDISLKISQTADSALNANNLGKRAGDAVVRSQEEMGQMLKAIKGISDASQNIKKIIKSIEEIAFQTNILALNAAVEAARAGSTGKGFAVVANEVRSLAQKSAESAKSTAELIETSLREVENGENLAARTALAFDDVAKDAGEIMVVIETIAHASEEQAASIQNISTGVEQISRVVQMNSATSQECAAASEELSGQAGVMKELIGQFRLE